MKKKLYLLVCFYVGISYSQTNTTLIAKESPTYKDGVAAPEIFAMHTTSKGTTSIVRGGNKELIFDLFDDKLQKTDSKVVETDKKEKYIGDLFLKNQILTFTVFEPSKKERILNCHVYNLDNKEHQKIQLFQANFEKKQSAFSKNIKRKNNFAFSPDKNYFVIATNNITKKLNAYKVHVFDSKTMQLVYEKSYQEHEKKYFNFNDVSIENDGTVYTLGKLYKDGKSDKKKGVTNYQFILNKIQANKEPETLHINLEEEFITNLSINNRNNKLYLLGFYSEKKSGLMKGGSNFVVDKEKLAIVSKKLYELPLEVYEGIYGDEKGEKKKEKNKELANFSIDYVLEDSKENTYLLAEKFYITTRYMSTGMGGGVPVTTYHYDDIIIFKFDKNGNLAWGRSIYKKANSPSYNAFLKDNQLHVILNSGKKITEKSDGRTKISKGLLESTALYDIHISETGKMTYTTIQENKDKNYYLPSLGTFENNRFIIVNDHKREKQFMILE